MFALVSHHDVMGNNEFYWSGLSMNSKPLTKRLELWVGGHTGIPYEKKLFSNFTRSTNLADKILTDACVILDKFCKLGYLNVWLRIFW